MAGISTLYYRNKYAMAQLVEALRCKPESRGFDGIIGIFFVDLNFRPHCGPGFDSSCNRNEYQGYFLGE